LQNITAYIAGTTVQNSCSALLLIMEIHRVIYL